jgi:hypothetical protein
MLYNVVLHNKYFFYSTENLKKIQKINFLLDEKICSVFVV